MSRHFRLRPVARLCAGKPGRGSPPTPGEDSLVAGLGSSDNGGAARGLNNNIKKVSMKRLLPAITLILPFAASAQTQVSIYGVVDAFAGRTATASAPQAVNAVNSGGMITS